MLNFIQTIASILEAKRKELNDLEVANKVDEIEYAILEDEIKDAEYILASTGKDFDTFNSAVATIHSQTTSNSIYSAIVEYEKNRKEVLA